MEVTTNSLPPGDSGIAIYDIAHEDTAPEDWPTKVFLLGDLNSRFAEHAMILPVEDATDHFIVQVTAEVYEGEG
jgi:hypothetical protein